MSVTYTAILDVSEDSVLFLPGLLHAEPWWRMAWIGSDGDHNGDGDGLIPLTVNEIPRLLAHLVLTPTIGLDRRLSWSLWRRRRQYQARRCHYRRRGETPPP